MSNVCASVFRNQLCSFELMYLNVVGSFLFCESPSAYSLSAEFCLVPHVKLTLINLIG